MFNIYIETCGNCGGAVKVIACIEDPVTIKKILARLNKKVAQAGLGLLPERRAPLQTGLFNKTQHLDYRFQRDESPGNSVIITVSLRGKRNEFD